jgi:hypothetical protein
MKTKFYLVLMPLLLILTLPPTGRAQTATPAAGDGSLDIQKEQLDIERLKLENEKLQLEIQLAKQAAPAPGAEPTATPTSSKDAILRFRQDFSNQAMALAKAHAAEADLWVLDLVNAELWVNGVRYSLYELPVAASEQKLKMTRSLDERMPNGTPRWRYRIANADLLKYESRDRGVFEITAPQAAGDFKILTPDSLSFASNLGDIRDNVGNLYFKYSGDDEKGDFKILRYNHDEGLAFSDKLEFWVGRDGSLQKVRFGTLDEN